MDKKGFEIATALTSITQVGLSVLVPVAILIWLARFLIQKFNLPDYIMVIAIILGVASGFYNMIRYLLMITETKNKKDK